jgi:imidazole glycerol-phosphate synthase subunit HisH
MQNIVIIKYNAGNTQSVFFALQRLGINANVTCDAALIAAADKVIFPGVGHANTAMLYLIENNLIDVIKQLKQPFLGICLGMQLMCNFSEEGNTKCLGIFDTDVKRFTDADLKVPQIGWNTILDLKTNLFDKIEEKTYVYMVHSYYANLCKYTIATCNYGLQYSAALQKDNFFGTQFHPEKSGDIGGKILQNFIEL